MPTYNVETFVAEAVQSILDQTYSNWELIIQDDGSDDQTPQIVRRMAAHDERIRVLPDFRSNKGVIAARNSLLKHVNGAFIAWMDSDDRSAHERLETQLEFLHKHPKYGAIGTAIQYADENMHPLRQQSFSKSEQKQAIDPDLCCATVMVRLAALRTIPEFRDAFRPGGEDGDWILQIADQTKITNIDEVLYTYRQHGSTSKIGAAAIKRLGVLARHAARERRQGRSDPIDSLKPDSALDYLADAKILKQSELSVDEKLTALNQPLPDHDRLVDVLIPAYNAGRLLDHCLNSLREQSFQNFEVLIFDDGSDDPVGFQDVEASLGNISFRLFRGDTNKGVVFARNHLLAKSSAKFIVWHDADDYSDRNRLEQQLRYLIDEPNCNAVGTSIKYVETTVVTRSEHYPTMAFGPDGFSGCCATFMLRREAAEKVGLFDARYSKASEDVDFLSRVEPYGSVHNLNEALYYYRRHGQQITEHPEWIDMQAFYLLTQQMKDYGFAPIDSDNAFTTDEKSLIEAFMEMRKLPRDGSAFAEMIVRMRLRDIKNAERSWLTLFTLAARFPRIMARFTVEFTRNNRRDILRGRLPPGLRNVSAVPNPDIGAQYNKHSETDHWKQPAAQIEVETPAAQIIAQCYDNWGDLDDALRYLTPSGKGIWGDVAFVRATGSKPDWNVFFNAPSDRSVKFSASPNRVIFAIGEPPTSVHRPLHEGQGEDTIVLTSDESLLRRDEPKRQYFAAPAMTRTWSVKKTYDFLKNSHVEEKPRRLSWVTSDVDLIQGHRVRLDFLHRMENAIEFDLFGRGFNPISDKWSGLAPYKYSIAFENTKSDWYFTEKLMDCFVAETMPLYYGSPKIHQFFPAESLVVIDPEDSDIIEKIITVVESDLWKSNRPAILEAKHLVLERYNTFAYLADLMENTKEPAGKPQSITVNPFQIDFGHRQ